MTQKGMQAAIISAMALFLLYIIGAGQSYTPPAPRPTPKPVAWTKTASPYAWLYDTEPHDGMYISAIPSDWKWQGEDNINVRDAHGNQLRTTKYNYEATGKQFVIWLENSSGKIVKVSYTDRGGTSSSQKKKATPTPDVSDFVHPEDFYDWYWDDFVDYEEAEEYYNSHGGK